MVNKLKKKLLSSSVFKFLIVGGCSTLIDFIIYMVLSNIYSLTLSKATSMVVASLFSYVVNKIFTFGNKEKTNFSYIIKYYIVFGLNFGVNLAVNYFVYSSTSSKLLAFIVATICGMTVNYIGQRFFVFVRAKEKI